MDLPREDHFIVVAATHDTSHQNDPEASKQVAGG